MSAPSLPPPPARARRPRTTKKSVLWIDRITTVGITAGGLAVIVAVLGIFVYLLSVVLPLFGGASLSAAKSSSLLPAAEVESVLGTDLDEYRTIGFVFHRDGRLGLFDAASGAPLGERRLFDGEATAFARSRVTGGIVVGFADGSVRLGRIAFASRFLDAASAEATPHAGLAPGARTPLGEELLERTVQGELRVVSVEANLDPPLAGAPSTAAVRRIDERVADDVVRLAVVRDGPSLELVTVERRENPMTGEVTVEPSWTPMAWPAERLPAAVPAFVLLATPGDQLTLAWPDGWAARWDLRDPAQPLLSETLDLVPDPAGRLTVFGFVNGEQSIVAGDSAGGVTAWFRVRPVGGTPNPDGFALVAAHRFEPAPGGATSFDPDGRGKSFAVGTGDGAIVLYALTSNRTLATVRLAGGGAVKDVRITPKGDGLAALGADGTLASWDLSNPHPETTWRSLFTKVWYEGYPEPGHTWQSSSGTDDFEPKFGLVPLVFGTVKATLYALLFALPIALFAAIYTSEFLDERWRSPVKSLVEVMASLPSVVLGFLAALVLAPLVENWILAVLVAFALVPVVILSAGYAWQLLPQRTSTLLGRRWQLPISLALALAAGALALQGAPLLERLFFAGNFKGWLDGRVGTAAPGIALVTWPPLVLALLLLDLRWISPALHRRLPHLGRGGAALLEIAKYAVLLAASFGIAALAGSVGASLGIDPRGSLVGTYVQRNALVVGFVMGFAVIPIIYTLSEDALSAVPKALRSASLGCGATRWQTAIRIVLPVALPGIFSAVMVGLGRAVGETMIVLMAAGNTPVMELNPFSGLRTLSANIAVELPEAVKDGTLYRTLFLAALTLFAVTFVLNTVAEIVRQRFRRRAMQL